MGIFVLFAFLFTSCSKDENSPIDDSEKATLSFGAILSDLASKNSDKQSNKQVDVSDLPECSDAQPAYVTVVLSQNGNEVVGTMEEPFRVDLVSGQVFTEEAPELELVPGEYSLDHFMVYDAAGNLIWVAPAGGPMAEFVDSPLPMDINLGAGVKKYVDVPVLCYDNRDVNEYGYLFFDLVPNEAIEFCIFGNYCDESGRHYAAQYSVDVWAYANGQRGEIIYEDLENVVEENADGDMAASPLCLALPDKEGMDEYYFEITLMDGEDYNATERVVRAGVLSDEEVRTFFEGDENVESYHFRTGCEGQDNLPVFQDPEDDAMFYKARLTELNESGVFGLAYLRLEGQVLETTVWAAGLTPNMVHPQHIHGFEDDSVNATCPPESASGSDDYITLGEGAPFYGPVLLPLYEPVDEFPVANSAGIITYQRTFQLGEVEFEAEGINPTAEELLPLVNRAIVLHGMFVEDDVLTEMDDENNDPDYIATLPVACGQIWDLD